MRHKSASSLANVELGDEPANTSAPNAPWLETVWVACWSGFLGIVAGLAASDWQVAVETAQVLADQVIYPTETSFEIYHYSGWSLLNQLSALLLQAGLSAKSASLVLSALGGMLAFQSLSLVSLALGGDRRFALLTPVLYQAFSSSWSMAAPAYPLQFLATPNTYGHMGRSFVLLAFGLLGRGHLRLAWFLLAVAPAVHPTLGTWGVVVALASTLLQRRVGTVLRLVWPALVAGALVLGLSLAVQFQAWQHLPAVATAEKHQFVEVVSALGDYHRPMIAPWHPGVVLNVLVAALAILWTKKLRDDLPDQALELLWCLAISGVLAAVAAMLTPFQDQLPWLFRRAMPGRFVNLVIISFPALAIGLVAAYQRQLAVMTNWIVMPVALAAVTFEPQFGLIAALFFGMVLLIAGLQTLPGRGVMLTLQAATMLAAAVVSTVRVTGIEAVLAVVLAEIGVWSFTGGARFQPRLVLGGLLIVAALLPGWLALEAKWKSGNKALALEGSLVRAARGQGMLLTGSDLFLVQVKTGRPVIFCGGGVDMLPYVPEAGPAAQRELSELYGISLLDPLRASVSMTGNRLLPQAAKELWQRRSSSEWRQLADEFKFTDVLVYKDWQLDLPLETESDTLRLYRVAGPDR
ncbi:MAG: hypothetical protein K1X74_07345 [Pirellulales bacterium]|nr:hypothetical protein [Pirellulales bacterium]